MQVKSAVPISPIHYEYLSFTHLVQMDERHVQPSLDCHQTQPLSHHLSHSSSAQPSIPVSPAAAVHTFRRCRDDLLSAITDPLHLANKLYSEGVISSETCEQVLFLNATPTEKIMRLLHAIEARLATHPSDLMTLVTILDDVFGQRDMARKLREMCCKLYLAPVYGLVCHVLYTEWEVRQVLVQSTV